VDDDGERVAEERACRLLRTAVLFEGNLAITGSCFQIRCFFLPLVAVHDLKETLMKAMGKRLLTSPLRLIRVWRRRGPGLIRLELFVQVVDLDLIFSRPGRSSY
jgi:hypothetical protein